MRINFGGLTVRYLDLTRLCQSQNGFVTDKDLRGENLSL